MRTLFQGTDRLYATTDVLFSVVECAECRLIRLFPWPSPAELRRYYPTTYWFQPDAGPAARLEQAYRRLVLRDHVHFVRTALEANPIDGAVLDVGCGGGLFPKLLRDRGYPAHGMDFSISAAQGAWHENGVPASVGLLTQAPFAPESLRAITMFHLLEHLYQPAEYLEAAWQLLRPGGVLVVQVPNVDSWQARMLRSNWNGFDVPRHLVNFKARDMQSLLQACGFEVVRSKYFSLRDNPAGLATSLAPSLDPMARRIRRREETPRRRLFNDAAYLALVLAAIPFTALEAAFQAGSTVMVHARKAG